jgi:hypothetical protein
MLHIRPSGRSNARNIERVPFAEKFTLFRTKATWRST